MVALPAPGYTPPPMLLLHALACTSWIDQEPACEYDIYGWSDDVIAHILTGKGDGEFDYDPEDVPRQVIKGAYDPAKGDFSWKIAYADDYYIVDASVEGFGTAYHNGDLDIQFTQSATDILEEENVEYWDVERAGCAMTIQSWEDEDQEDVFQAVGIYESEKTYAWTAEETYSDIKYTWSGSQRQNLARSYTVEAEDGSYYWFNEESPAGTEDAAFERHCSDAVSIYWCEGSRAVEFDGGSVWSYTETNTNNDQVIATVEKTFNYDGSGTGVIVYTSGVTCTLNYLSDGDCSRSCDNNPEASGIC